MRLVRHPWVRYAMALVLVLLATGLSLWPIPLLESNRAWLTLYPAVVIAAIYGGFAAAMLAIVLACLSVTYLWPILAAQPVIDHSFGMTELVVFAIGCTLTSGLVETLHRAKTRANLAQQQAEAAALASAKSEQFIKSITNAMPNMIGYWDRDLRFRFANHAYLEWFGKLPQTLIGMHIRELMGERLYTLNEPYILGALAGQQQSFTRTLTKADGAVGYILGNYIPDRDDQGAISGIFIHAVDVTELKMAQAKLEQAASVFQSATEGITITNADGVFLSVNPAFTNITGYSAEEALGKTPRILKSNRHDHAFYVNMWHHITTQGQWQGDIWNRRKNGEVYLERITITMIRNEDGMPVHYVSVFSDITDLWHKDEYLRHLAFHDALTNLPNRSLLMERLNVQIASAEREPVNLALLFLDLDGFKAINDNFGHDVGDELLKQVASRLVAIVRDSDTVARLGGDEFVIKLTNPADQAEVTHIANRIIAGINEPMDCRGHQLQVGISIGIVLFPIDGHSAVALLKHADTAMYVAKTAGKNTFRFYLSGMANPASNKRI